MMASRKIITSLLTALTLLFVVGLTYAETGVKGTAKADSLESCVAETPFMRRNHFELILHQRDITVHEGIRKTDDSLAGCVDCHARSDAAGKPVAVNAQGEFCAACHDQVAVSIDCFSCHTTIPGGE